MNFKWASVAIIPALMTLTLSVAGAPRAAVADVQPLCTVEWPTLNGCPTSDDYNDYHFPIAAHTVPASPQPVSVPGL